jgi:hypothetical protein
MSILSANSKTDKMILSRKATRPDGTKVLQRMGVQEHHP